MLKVEAQDHKGRGIARLNNKVVFIENALPGEVVDINILKEKKHYIEAKASSIINKSSRRNKSICPYFGVCGGCDIMHMDYDSGLKFKEDKIKNIVNKYFGSAKVNSIIKCDNPLFYRNKLTLNVNGNIGLYKKKSYDIVPIDKCYISNEIINDAIKYLKKLDLKKIDKIILRVGSNELMVIIETNDKNLNIDPIKDIANSIYLKIKDEYVNICGSKYIYETLGKYKYVISPDSFFQVNINTCTKLYEKIKNYVGKGKKILDLYCGTGSIGIFLSEGNFVTGIEINKEAISDANRNKEINELDNINFICGDSGKSLENIKSNFDVVIVDPPRNGLNKETITNVLKIGAKNIIYVSCDAMTMVRDLNVLSKKYKILEITPFDMFPNTSHVECITYLEKV